MATKALKCSRCQRPYRGRGEWNVTLAQGVIVGALCPRCQTPAENAEATIHEATLDYSTDDLGRVRGNPKGDR